MDLVKKHKGRFQDLPKPKVIRTRQCKGKQMMGQPSWESEELFSQTALLPLHSHMLVGTHL